MEAKCKFVIFSSGYKQNFTAEIYNESKFEQTHKTYCFIYFFNTLCIFEAQNWYYDTKIWSIKDQDQKQSCFKEFLSTSLFSLLFLTFVLIYLKFHKILYKTRKAIVNTRTFFKTLPYRPSVLITIL